MRLLIGNDDGIFAQGIQALANALHRAGHGVTVVCPDRERSATGHGLTLHDPIRAEEVTGMFDPGVRAWACSGTPSDCIKLGLGALLDEPPDWVLSGINHGPNLGTDILYSGTVSAAMEGLLEGIPSIALSLADFASRDFSVAARTACELIEEMTETPPERPTLFNVNIPAIAAEAIAGRQVTRLGYRRYFDEFEKRLDPRGRTYYWLGGELLEEVNPEEIYPPTDQPLPTDVQAIRDRYITLTPLHFNLTDLAALDGWHQRLSRSNP